jgi:hypothetical protein
MELSASLDCTAVRRKGLGIDASISTLLCRGLCSFRPVTKKQNNGSRIRSESRTRPVLSSYAAAIGNNAG